MLHGHVFKEQRFGNQIFALFIDTFLGGHCGVASNYKNSMGLTYSGSNVIINSGAVCIRGRFLEEDSSTIINAGTNTLFCKLVIEIDLDKDNTQTEFIQGQYKILVGESDYPSLIQQDIVKNNSGVYQYELARFKTGLSGITTFVDKRTFLDFESIYSELEKQTNLATKKDLESKLDKSGGTMTGTIYSMGIVPKTSALHSLGSSSKCYDTVYANKINCGGHAIAIKWDDSSETPYFKVDNNTSTFYNVSSDNHAIKLNWTPDRKLQLIIDGQILGNLQFAN